MSKVEEIEHAIEQLSREELFRLRDFVQDRFDDAWDRQMEEDARNGNLDALAESALKEFKAGNTKAFPPSE